MPDEAHAGGVKDPDSGRPPAAAEPATDKAPSPRAEPADGMTAFHLYALRSPTVLGLALVAVAVGFAQFGAVAALGEVAKIFGHRTGGPTIAEEAGLSGTELGIGLAILRIASIGALFSTSLADRFGRQPTLRWATGLGLLLTAAVALSPSYWAFVAIYAVGRPLLSTATALTQVMSAEQTSTKVRAQAIALVTGGYGLGSGLAALAHAVIGGQGGFRVLFALCLVPLVALIVFGGRITEPDRFLSSDPATTLPLLGAVGATHRRRLAIVVSIAFALAFMAGPVNSFVYLYGENVLGLSSTKIAIFVISAGACGLAGLILGQYLSDHAGRRGTGGVALVVMAACAALTYSDGALGLGVGYIVGVGAASVLAPALGALSNEVFPTSVRASVAGWLIAASVAGGGAGLVIFGAISDAGNAFRTGAVVVGAVAAASSLLFALLPETAGLEPEEVSPELPRARRRLSS